MRRRICAVICILSVMLVFTAYASSSWQCVQCGHRVPAYLGDICPYCGAEKHVHTWKEATCTEPKTCTECGETEGTAAGHQWDDGIVLQAASCQSPGVMRYTCTVCGSTREEELAKDPDNHTGGTEIRNAQDATCTENGYSGDTYCKGCGELISKGTAIKALGHEWQDATYTAPKTCARCGATEGKPQPLDVGSIITFGHYEQDNNTSNGAEPIEWIVLEHKGDTAVLLSKYALDARAYNDEFTEITWEGCTLRSWLNGEFLNSAFTTEEQRQLETVSVTADKNPSYSTDPGNDTKDKVFLLSIREVEKYFSADEARVCFSSEYTKSRGVYTNDRGACWWWLRSPGNVSYYAASVGNVGSVYNRGNYVLCDNGSVRPVVVLRLS